MKHDPVLLICSIDRNNIVECWQFSETSSFHVWINHIILLAIRNNPSDVFHIYTANFYICLEYIQVDSPGHKVGISWHIMGWAVVDSANEANLFTIISNTHHTLNILYRDLGSCFSRKKSKSKAWNGAFWGIQRPKLVGVFFGYWREGAAPSGSATELVA